MKHVKIKTAVPVHGAFNYPLLGNFEFEKATEDQIYRCLVSGAQDLEVGPNGEEQIKLTFQNYNKQNFQEKVEVKEVQEPKKEDNQQPVKLQIPADNVKYHNPKQNKRLDRKK